MGRAAALASLALVGTLLVSGCEPVDPDAAPAGEQPASTAGVTVDEGAVVDLPDPIPAEGPGEAAALAALPGLLPAAEQAVTASGGQWPDLQAAEPRLVAHLVRAEMDGQVTLFEVRADGIAHSLNAYHRAFDSGSLIWTPAAESDAAAAQPRSSADSAAAEAVRSVMADAFPDETLTLAVAGYRFAYVAGDAVVLTVEVGADGALGAVSPARQ